jgi:flagellar motility protein MotE (MotC chaperone)
MKQVLTYVVLFFVTLLLAVQAVLILFAVKPAAFSILTAPAERSSRVAVGVSANPLHNESAGTQTEARRDSLLLDSLQLARATSEDDSIRILHDRLEVEIRKAAQLEQKLASQSSSADSSRTKERKGIAKMLESMSAEDAARILKTLTTGEAKKVLMLVKKRQAGKILSAMEPQRAASMMK